MSDTKGDGFGKEAPEFGPRPRSRHIGEKAETPARADFKKWARRDRWHIAEGAMLILGSEPFDVKKADWAHSLPSKSKEGFDDIYETALRSDGFTAEGHWVSPRHFLAWAHEKGYPVPAELEEAVNRFHPEAGPYDDVNQFHPDAKHGAGGPKWPWGNHETKLLRDLAAAADRFWKNYDPGDPTTAPTNQQVTKWLKDRGVADRVAEVMAQILRADGLPTGPRK